MLDHRKSNKLYAVARDTAATAAEGWISTEIRPCLEPSVLLQYLGDGHNLYNLPSGVALACAQTRSAKWV